MVKALEMTLAEVANLPDADQEEIGRQLPSHVEKLRALRAALDDGVRSLDAGEGRPFDPTPFCGRKAVKCPQGGAARSGRRKRAPTSTPSGLIMSRSPGHRSRREPSRTLAERSRLSKATPMPAAPGTNYARIPAARRRSPCGV